MYLIIFVCWYIIGISSYLCSRYFDEKADITIKEILISMGIGLFGLISLGVAIKIHYDIGSDNSPIKKFTNKIIFKNNRRK